MQIIKNSIRQLIALVVVFIITAAICLITSDIYANAFLYKLKGIVVSFCAFLVIDVVCWIDRALIENGKTQSNKKEIGWTIGLLVCIAYFWWRHWNRYSLWHIWMIAIVSTILVVGMVIRFCGKWDVDRVRWLTCSACCGTVALAIAVCILIFDPMTVKQAEEIVLAEQGKGEYSLIYIEESKHAETPLGFYMFGIKDENGLFLHGRGRAVLYFGENPEVWRNSRSEQENT